MHAPITYKDINDTKKPYLGATVFEVTRIPDSQPTCSPIYESGVRAQALPLSLPLSPPQFRVFINGPPGVGKTYIMKNTTVPKSTTKMCDTDSFFQDLDIMTKYEAMDEGDDKYAVYDDLLTKGFIKFEQENPAKNYIYFGLLEESNYVPPFGKFDKMILLLPEINTHAKQYFARTVETLFTQPAFAGYFTGKERAYTPIHPKPIPWEQIDWMNKKEFTQTREFFERKVAVEKTHQLMTQAEIFAYIKQTFW